MKAILIEILVKTITAIAKELVAGIQELIAAYVNKKRDEETNESNREDVENANTDEEFQDAADGLAGHLGRQP